MTDYLELLLNGWQEEDEGEPFVWKRMGYRGWNGMDDVQQKTANKVAGVEMAVGAVDRLPAEERHKGNGQSGAPEVRLAALERAVARGKTQQVAREWSRERTVTAQTEAERPVVGMNGTALEMRRGLAGVLDAAFERDARRYDGPLGLF